MIKISIYEDDSLYRESLRSFIDDSNGFEVVASYSSCLNILKDTRTIPCDVILLDINIPKLSGIEALKILRQNASTVKILILSGSEDNESVFESLRYGANGYILKETPFDKLLIHIQEVYFGGAPISAIIATEVLKMFSKIYFTKDENFDLSEREQGVLQLLVKGYSYKMISKELFISIDTVRFHIKKIYEKLKVHSKSEAIIKAYKHNLFY